MKKILYVLLILISLFIFASCSSEPEKNPTIPPAPGNIPAVPNADTIIKSVSNEDKVVIKTILDDLQLIVSQITGEGGKDIFSDPDLSLSGTITVSAPAKSIKIGEATLQSGALSATLTANESGVSLEANTTVKIGTAETKALSVVFNLVAMEATIELGEDEIVLSDIADDMVVTRNGSLLEDNENVDNDEYDLFLEDMEPVAIAVLNGLLNATFRYDDFVGSYDIDDVGKVTVTASGIIILNSSLNPTYFETDEGSIIKSGSITFNGFDVEVGLDDVTGGLYLDGMTLSVSDVLIANDKDADGRTSSTSFKVGLDAKEISLYLKYGDMVKANLVIANTDIDATYNFSSETTFSPYSYESNSVLAMKLSTDIGFGLKVGGNSMGFLTNVSFDCADMDDFDPEEDLSITPMAATLNSSYYDPAQFLEALIEAGSETFDD